MGRFSFRLLAFPLVRFGFARFALGRFSFARFPARLFVLFALRSLVFRLLAVPFVRFCFARLALARFSLVFFPARSFLFRSPCARSFFVHSLSRSFASVSLGLCSVVFPSLAFPLVRFCFALSFFVRLNPTPLCASFLVHLDVHLYVCLFLQRDNPPPFFVTPSRISLSCFGSFFLGCYVSGALLLEHSNAPTLDIKETKKAHAQAKATFPPLFVTPFAQRHNPLPCL